MPTTAVAREEKEIEASIIDAAGDLIADGGLPALSMRAVAVRLRLRRRRPSSDLPRSSRRRELWITRDLCAGGQVQNVPTSGHCDLVLRRTGSRRSRSASSIDRSIA